MGSLNSKPFIDKYGNRYWYKNGKLHSYNDMPAIVFVSGRLQWYKDDKLHRDDGPAIIWPDGELEWYKNDRKYIPTMRKL